MKKCDRCDGELILCPADYPWHDEDWICRDCESIYAKDDYICPDAVRSVDVRLETKRFKHLKI